LYDLLLGSQSLKGYNCIAVLNFGVHMSDQPNKELELSRKVWLAGIGAYGRAIGDAQDVYAKMGKETSKAFDELVGRGEDLEAKVASAAKQYAPMMSGEAVKSTVGNISDRLEKMKATLGLTEVAAQQQDDISELGQRMDAMDAKLDTILAAIQAINPASDNSNTDS